MAKTDYVRTDFAGCLYNIKYQPNIELNGSLYHGYKSCKEETLFYDFAVQGYDLTFCYKGKRYFFLTEENYVALCDENYTEEYQRFEDGNSALEQFKIDGIPLIKLIDKLEEVEAV